MKKVHIKSAIPIYIAAAVWLVMGLIFPKFLMKLPGLLVTAALSVGTYFGGLALFPVYYVLNNRRRKIIRSFDEPKEPTEELDPAESEPKE